MASKFTVFSDIEHRVGRFLADEGGTTAIEYALIASGIAAAIVSIVFGVGNSIMTNLYNKIASVL